MLKFLAENWPSFGAAGVFSAVYLRLHRTLAQIEQAQSDAAHALRLINRLIRTHCKRHPEDIERLIMSENKEADE